MTKIDPLIPDFLIIGAGKCGTTSVDNYLRHHPEIFIPKVKEPNFYGYATVTEDMLSARQSEIDHFRNSITDLDEYLELFASAEPHQVKGETSNTYLYHKNAPERIKHYNPDMKLIAIFRQPAERLWSRYMHLARENKTPTDHFSDCLDRSSIYWERNDLINEGFYHKNLSKIYSLFPKNQIRVYLFEDLKNDGPGTLKDIYKFLGVDPDFEMEELVQYNQSGVIKNKPLDGLIGNHGIIPKMAKYVFGKHYDALKDNTKIQSIVVKVRKQNLDKPQLDPEIKKILTHDVYEEDILRLQKLIGRDLSHWIN
ncbi:MAG: sulfotransferase [Marinoscillum sp.]